MISCKRPSCAPCGTARRSPPWTKLTAWLFTILRNAFYTEFRKRTREVEDADGVYAARLTSPPEQSSRLDVQDLKAAMDRLPVEQREVLILVSGEASHTREQRPSAVVPPAPSRAGSIAPALGSLSFPGSRTGISIQRLEAAVYGRANRG